MTYEIKRNEIRALECQRLASRACDPAVRLELLKLHQAYLAAAAQLRNTAEPVR